MKWPGTLEDLCDVIRCLAETSGRGNNPMSERLRLFWAFVFSTRYFGFDFMYK